MTKKTTFNNPDSQEREYTRDMLRLSKALQSDINKVLIPELPRIVAQFNVESRSDGWSDVLAVLMRLLAQLSESDALVVIRKLPGHFSAISKFNEAQFKMLVKANTGITLPPVVQGAPVSRLGINVFRTEPYLAPLAEGWVKENTDLIKTVPTKLHADLEGIIRRGVMNGDSVKKLTADIKARYPMTDHRAKLIAQDQTLKLNSNLTQYRLKSVGVSEYTWKTVNDNRVRPHHRERNGKVFAWDKPPSDGNPGQPVRCRCRAEAVWPEDERDID